MTPCPESGVVSALTAILCATLLVATWLAHVAWSATRALRARDTSGEELAEEVMRRRIDEAKSRRSERRPTGFRAPRTDRE